MPRPEIERPVVLYVEDHPVNAMLMEALFLRRPGLELVVAADGAQGLVAARLTRPSLLLLDLDLPDTHGSLLLARLRALPGCERVPAIAVTADTLFDVERAGFVERWAKPLDLQRVLRRLDELLAPAPRQPEPALHAAR